MDDNEFDEWLEERGRHHDRMETVAMFFGIVFSVLLVIAALFFEVMVDHAYVNWLASW